MHENNDIETSADPSIFTNIGSKNHWGAAFMPLSEGNVQVENLTEEECRNAEALSALLERGNKQRTVAATAMNSETAIRCFSCCTCAALQTGTCSKDVPNTFLNEMFLLC